MTTEQLIIAIILFLFIFRMIIVGITSYLIKPKDMLTDKSQECDDKEK
ncbi:MULTISPECIES: hypothetical protein [unclassified Streptococcus]|nr:MULTISPECIES: hypothetical protein [unclassified Streptococcus]